MLNAENANLRSRVCELERRVRSQEDELVCLRSTVADFLRRLTSLEKSAFTPATPSTKVLNREPDVFKRLSSRPHSSGRNSRPTSLYVNSTSTANLNCTPLRKNSCGEICSLSYSKGLTESGDSNYQTPTPSSRNDAVFKRRFIKRSDNEKSMVNVSTGRSSRGSPMRKWMSSADVKLINCSSNQQQLNLTGTSVTPTENLLKSYRSVNFCHRDPLFLQEQHLLQVFIRGKSTLLPVPSSVEHVSPIAEVDPPLSCTPQLEWIQGYRGKDSRNNLHVIPTGEIVYFIGAVVVLFDPKEMSQRHYTQHTSEIRCIAVHPNKLHIATGQTSRHSPEKKILNEHRTPICSPAALDNILQSDQTQAHVRIWDAVTLQTIRIIGISEACFERSIACVAFSRHDGGVLLAVIDDSYEHTLSIWDWQKQKKLVETKSANDQVFACEFHPYLKDSLVLYGKGHFNFWTFGSNSLAKHAVTFEGRDKPKLVLSVCFAHSERVYSGDSNGTITSWDFRSCKVIKRVAKVHKGGVWSLCSLGGGRIVSGGKDHCIFEWSEDLAKLAGPISVADEAGTIRTIVPFSSSCLLIGTTKNEILKGDMKQGFKFIMQGHADELWALSTRPNSSQYLTGSIDGTLRMWDSISKMTIWTMLIQEGVTCLDFHLNGSVFVLGTGVGVWMVYDADTQEQLYLCDEPTQPISTARFSSDGTLLAVASKDGQTNIYSVSEDCRHFLKVSRLANLTSFITTIDWSTTSTLIRTNNNDWEHQIWCVATGKIVDLGKTKNAIWASSRCVVSFENGCIAQTIPGVMAIERSRDSSFVAVAMDNGAIRFYRYPTTSIMATYREIFGHSTFIGNIGFLESSLISIGAKDDAIFQWKI
uniref:HELP domain-containing protein n=1 Tax=Syphacia muris TaxID=451379 RepID=A0A0N5ASS5_9BILA